MDGDPWYHGGNLKAAMRIFPDAPLPWIDLSTGINPLPYPVGLLPESVWSRLPEPSDLAALEAAARVAYGVKPGRTLVAAPGTQSIIQWLPRLAPARRVGILGFTYGEHENSWRMAGSEVRCVDDPADLMQFDIGVVVNPNNPDGRFVPPDHLIQIAQALDRRGGLLIVDEAFIDMLDPALSLAPELPISGAMVLRSFGKTYGLAGLRLGFAVTSPQLGRVLRAALGSWAISGPAIELGRRALADGVWRAEMVSKLHELGARLDRLLTGANFDVVGKTPLFRLARHDDAARWFERLARAGILTRPFLGRPIWLRFGLPVEEADWQRLATALAAN
jgi:cobalamin biosynthetic protein CobC